MYNITVTNLSAKQPLSQFIVIAHNSRFSLFTLGEPASSGVQALTENGNGVPLENELPGTPGIGFVQRLDGGFGGGIGGTNNMTITVPLSRQFPLVTIASMLANTNDA